MSEHKSDSSGQPMPPGLTQALDQNEQVRDKVEKVAGELQLINEVLKQELPAEAHEVEEVASALEKHTALEETVQHCADELAEVNQTLASEIEERQRLEQTLAETQAELTIEKNKPA